MHFSKKVSIRIVLQFRMRKKGKKKADCSKRKSEVMGKSERDIREVGSGTQNAL